MLPNSLQFLGEFGKVAGLLTDTQLHLRAPLLVSLGAIPGALSRYYMTIWLSRWLGTSFPFGTFAINLSGALLMGFVATLAVERAIIAPDVQLLVATGFLGSYTTFSTYMLDTAVLLRVGSRVKALFYWTGSAILGWIFLEVGIVLARSLG
jgi:CrcB protein